MAQEERYYAITNRFVFARVFSDPENARPLLEAVMGARVKEIRYVEAEHGIEPSLRGRGVRMDVFVDDGNGTVYDVEMQNEDKGNLALRSRYLLSAFDRDRIERGKSYTDLKRTIVIFICCFDPLDMGRRVYTIRPTVLEAGVPFEDGTLRVFLNAAGAAEDAKEPEGRLSAFLSYVDGGGTMGDEWLERLEARVRALNVDEGWREAVLSFESLVEEEVAFAREKALSEGLETGREKGLAEGREKGLAEGREKGLAEGRERETDLNRRLALALSEAGRGDEFLAAALDSSRKRELLEEFGLTSTDC